MANDGRECVYHCPAGDSKAAFLQLRAAAVSSTDLVDALHSVAYGFDALFDVVSVAMHTFSNQLVRGGVRVCARACVRARVRCCDVVCVCVVVWVCACCVVLCVCACVLCVCACVCAHCYYDSRLACCVACA